MRIMYQAQLRVRHDQLLEKEKQLDAALQVLAVRKTLGTQVVKDEALQVLAARKTLETQVAGIVFVFTAGVLCGACCRKRNS